MILAIALLGAIAAPLAAHEYKLGDLTILHPYAVETSATARTGAAYLTIRNTGAAPDRLIEVRTKFPRTMLHTTEVDANGVARMIAMDGVAIPARGDVTLAPQAGHVMMMGLEAPLLDGQKIDATLVFETAGEIEVQFNVESRDATEGPEGGTDMDGGHMGHDG
jgi:periplasmic copper chaperone A